MCIQLVTQLVKYEILHFILGAFFFYYYYIFFFVCSALLLSWIVVIAWIEETCPFFFYVISTLVRIWCISFCCCCCYCCICCCFCASSTRNIHKYQNSISVIRVGLLLWPHRSRKKDARAWRAHCRLLLLFLSRFVLHRHRRRAHSAVAKDTTRAHACTRCAWMEWDRANAVSNSCTQSPVRTVPIMLNYDGGWQKNRLHADIVHSSAYGSVSFFFLSIERGSPSAQRENWRRKK